jgi:7-keto-8-aminopelargonate synthetase-like enzyme/predicted N-acyltransferase
MTKKNTSTSIVNTVNDLAIICRQKGITHLYTEDEQYNGRTIRINGQDLINFGSCSYLGLDMDERLKEGAIQAIKQYGVQFSSSRSYIACTLYKEWEMLLTSMFNAPLILSTSVSLGHHAVIPVIVENDHAIIMDQQVHASVQDAVLKMQSRGVAVSVIRHNRLDELEARITELVAKHDKIWYMADGVYSMYGDYAPMEALMNLLKKFKQLHLYVDDAHGMSIEGPHGTGVVLSQVPLHKRMVLATSLNKAFAAGGGAFVFADEALCQKVKNCGGALIFSGPHQIPVIGAGIASAKIHLSDEIYTLQKSLKEKLHYCHELLEHYRLPVLSNRDSPISFVGLGLNRVAFNMVKRMMSDGNYVNLAIFPAVPETCSGIRFTITNHHSFTDIERLTERLAYHFPKALSDEGRTITDVHRAFRKVITFKTEELPLAEEISKPPSTNYTIQHETTIHKIDQKLWDRLLGENETYDWDGLNLLEKAFKNNKEPENNWGFHYYIIRNETGKPVLATFCTVVLTKDDMLSPAPISHKIEMERIINPYYLCSRTLMIGSMLTAGKQLYIDRTIPDWKNVMMLLLDTLWKEQEKQKANVLNIRDFDESDQEIQDFFREQGFLKIHLPDGHVIRDVDERKEKYLEKLKSENRYYIRKRSIENEQLYDVEVVENPSEADINHYYQLYKNVARKNIEFNTFHLPRKFFRQLRHHAKWEIVTLKSKKDKRLAGIAFSYKTNGVYHFVITGLDYNYIAEHVYPQLLWQLVLRAQQLHLRIVNFGFTASQNKRKFGSEIVHRVAFVQIQDNYNMSVINAIANTGSVPADKGVAQDKITSRRMEILRKRKAANSKTSK